MKSESNILLITTDENTVNTVNTTLSGIDEFSLSGVCKEISEMPDFLRNKIIHVIIVDIDNDPSRVLYELSELLRSHTEAYIIVISQNFHKEFVLRAMQAGARSFIEKQHITNELPDALLHLDKTSKKKTNRDKSGSIISIFSAGGGCGATTVSVNMASELRLLSSQPILVIDLDNHYGTVSTYMGIKSQYGIADVINRNGLIDKCLIQSSAFNHMENFHVLVSPVSVDSCKVNSLKLENLPSVISSCRELYRYTVIDAPRMSEQEMINLAGLSDIVLIIFQLTIKDVHYARRIVESLTQSGIPAQKIMPLANRFKKRGPCVRLEDSRKVIGLNSCDVIRSNWKTAMKSVNHGKPLSQIAKGSGLRGDFQKIAKKIHSYLSNGNGNISG